MAVLTEAAGTGLVGTPPSLTAGATPVTVTAFPYIVVGAGRGIMAGWGGRPHAAALGGPGGPGKTGIIGFAGGYPRP
jgi:hypothetical protein